MIPDEYTAYSGVYKTWVARLHLVHNLVIIKLGEQKLRLACYIIPVVLSAHSCGPSGTKVGNAEHPEPTPSPTVQQSAQSFVPMENRILSVLSDPCFNVAKLLPQGNFNLTLKNKIGELYEMQIRNHADFISIKGSRSTIKIFSNGKTQIEGVAFARDTFTCKVGIGNKFQRLVSLNGSFYQVSVVQNLAENYLEKITLSYLDNSESPLVGIVTPRNE